MLPRSLQPKRGEPEERRHNECPWHTDETAQGDLLDVRPVTGHTSCVISGKRPGGHGQKWGRQDAITECVGEWRP